MHATIELLGKKGPTGLSAATLAREVGVSKATIFHHFSSLDEVPLAALDLFVEQMLLAAIPTTTDLQELLSSLGEISFSLMTERQDFLRAYFVFTTKAMFDERLREKLLESLEYFKIELAELFEKCGTDRERALQLSYLAMMCLDGASLHLQINNDLEGARKAWDFFGRLATGVRD